MEDEFNIESIKIAETYNPNDPFSPLPPAPKTVKLYENFDDILIRTSREEYLKNKAQRQRERKRQKERDRRHRQSWSYMLTHNKNLESNENLVNDDQGQEQGSETKKEASKELSGIAEMKKIMKEMYCKPNVRPPVSNSRPKKIVKKPLAPTYKGEIDIFDFTPISTRKNDQTKFSKDIKPNVEIKQEPDTERKPNVKLLDDKSNKSQILNEYNAANSIDTNEVKVKMEFNDTYIKDEPFSDDYDNQPAVSYDETTDTFIENVGNREINEQQNQNGITKSHVVQNFDYRSLLEEAEDDYGDMSSHTYYTEVEGFIKQEIPDDCF